MVLMLHKINKIMANMTKRVSSLTGFFRFTVIQTVFLLQKIFPANSHRNI